MTLEHLMAFTVSPDHGRQEQVWDAIKDGWQKEPWRIRRALTETAGAASDKRAAFVGVEAYEAAGGVVLRDLFQSDEGGWLRDVVLLDRLTADKLKAQAEEILAEGWKWVETAVSLPYGATQGLRALVGEPIAMNAEESAAHAALQGEYDKLCEAYDSQEELPETVDQRLGEIEAAIEALDNRPLRYAPEQIAIAGALVSLDADGVILVQRGYVRAQDEPTAHVGDEHADDAAAQASSSAPASTAPTALNGANSDPSEDEPGEGLKPLPERLMLELTAHRTLALRDAVASNPRVAMTALLHKLASDTFCKRPAGGVLEANVRHVFFAAQADHLGNSVSARAIAARQAEWEACIPTDDGPLWDWLVALDDTGRGELLAHCVSFGVNALCERPNPYGASGVTEQGLRLRLRQSDRLAEAAGLDMVAVGWRPTVDNYLGRVPKQRILEAVREGAGERAAQLIDHLKKADMAREAERMLAETGWLPEALRCAEAAAAPVDATEPQGDEEALPAFLSEDGGEDEAGASEDEPDRRIAAE